MILEHTMGGISIDWAPVQSSLAQVTPVCCRDRAGSVWSDSTPHLGEFDAQANDISLALRNAGIPLAYVLASHT